MSGLVGIVSTFGPLSFVIKGLFWSALGPSPAAHTFGAASAKNSGGGWQTNMIMGVSEDYYNVFEVSH